ncbi:hypothetical protein V2J09_005814 [Rumex salicifolius]
MATQDSSMGTQHTSQRPLAMALALVAAVVLSPLYASRHSSETRYDHRWNSGFVLPVVLAGLIIAIKTTSSMSSSSFSLLSAIPETDPSSAIRVGGSSWGYKKTSRSLPCKQSFEPYKIV